MPCQARSDAPNSRHLVMVVRGIKRTAILKQGTSLTNVTRLSSKSAGTSAGALLEKSDFPLLRRDTPV